MHRDTESPADGLSSTLHRQILYFFSRMLVAIGIPRQEVLRSGPVSCALRTVSSPSRQRRIALGRLSLHPEQRCRSSGGRRRFCSQSRQLPVPLQHGCLLIARLDRGGLGLTAERDEALPRAADAGSEQEAVRELGSIQQPEGIRAS